MKRQYYRVCSNINMKLFNFIIFSIIWSVALCFHTLDDELYFDNLEIDFPYQVPKLSVQKTTDILFRPQYCIDGKPGLLTRVRDCTNGFELNVIYQNNNQQWYRIGCCTIDEDTLEDKMASYYDLIIAREMQIDDEFDGDIVVFDTPNDLGKSCVTQNGVDGIILMHSTCQALNGYIERSDRNFKTTQIQTGCCPLHRSAARKLSVIN